MNLPEPKTLEDLMKTHQDIMEWLKKHAPGSLQTAIHVEEDVKAPLVVKGNGQIRIGGEFFRFLKDTTHAQRSWNDGPDGGYSNTCYNCGRQFTGSRGRCECRVCAAPS